MGSVITVRVPRALKAELRRYGVEVSEVTRRALEAEVRERRRMELEEAARILGEALERIPADRLVRSIREDRGELK